MDLFLAINQIIHVRKILNCCYYKGLSNKGGPMLKWNKASFVWGVNEILFLFERRRYDTDPSSQTFNELAANIRLNLMMAWVMLTLMKNAEKYVISAQPVERSPALYVDSHKIGVFVSKFQKRMIRGRI